MIYAKVDAQAKKTLQVEMNKATDAKWYRRLKGIDLSGQDLRASKLSQMFDRHAGTIRRYVHNYNEAGLDGLRPGYGKGRPLSVEWTKAQWLVLLAQSPSAFAELEIGAQN